MANPAKISALPSPRSRAAQLAAKMEGKLFPGDVFMEKHYHLYRWNHLVIFCLFVVLAGCNLGVEGYDDATYPTVAVGIGITLFVELYYLWWNGRRISVAYLLLASTYVALMSGLAVMAFTLSRRLFADPA